MPDTTMLERMLSAGLALIPIPRGRKGPTLSGWNRREACITDPARAGELAGQNAGLAHAYSGTCALDVDDFQAAAEWFEARKIDLAALFQTDHAVQVRSGQPNRGKLLFRLPAPRLSVRVSHEGRTLFELRCATSDGLTVQDVVYGTHPEGRPYTVIGDPSMIPDAPAELLRVWDEQIAAETRPRMWTSTPAAGAAALAPQQAAELRQALAYLDADDRDTWVRVGAALHPHGEPGYWLWTEWSRQSAKFDPADQRRVWLSFRDARENNASVRTVFAMAQARGWTNPLSREAAPVVRVAPTAAAPAAPLASEAGGAFGESFTPPEYVVDGILLRGYLHALTGRSNAGKTSIGLALACAVVLGRNFGSARTALGKVLFLAGENPEDVRLRVRGFMQYATVFAKELDGLVFVPGRFDLAARHQELERLAAKHGGFSAVLVDSSAAFFPGDDENDNAQMSAHAENLRRLTTLAGRPAVLVLCHPAKSAEGHDGLLPRGGSAFLNELDANLTAWKEGEVVQLGFNKIRGPAFDFLNLQLFVWKFEGMTTNLGSPITSVIALPADARKAEELDRQAETEEDMLLGVMKRAGKPLSLRVYADQLGWKVKSGDPAVSRVLRCMQRLEKDRLVQRYRRKWVLTNKGKKGVESAED